MTAVLARIFSWQHSSYELVSIRILFPNDLPTVSSSLISSYTCGIDVVHISLQGPPNASCAVKDDRACATPLTLPLGKID